MAISITIILIGVISGSYLVLGVKTITALEGKIIADDVINNSVPKFVCVSINNHRELDKNGKSESWEYRYAYNDSELKGILLIVHANKEVENSGIFNATISTFAYYDNISPFINWTMDSPHALKITFENNVIDMFINKYSSVKYDMGLGVRDSIDNCEGEFVQLIGQPSLIWTVSALYEGAMEDIHYAKICIDANTGAVLLADSD